MQTKEERAIKPEHEHDGSLSPSTAGSWWRPDEAHLKLGCLRQGLAFTQNGCLGSHWTWHWRPQVTQWKRLVNKFHPRSECSSRVNQVGQARARWRRSADQACLVTSKLWIKQQDEWESCCWHFRKKRKYTVLLRLRTFSAKEGLVSKEPDSYFSGRGCEANATSEWKGGQIQMLK